jgi:tetratricopeptide (TPR) repeat protein
MITEAAGGGQEADDLLSAAAYAGETGRCTAQCDLADALEIPLGSAGRWSELAAINEHAVAAARRLDDDHRLAAALIGRGRGRIGLREFSAADADLAEALAVAERVADLGLCARAQRALARLGAHQHRWEIALHHDECGLSLHRRRGDLLGEAHAHNAIGWHLAHLDRPAEALDSCRQGLMIFVEHRDQEGEALTLDSIGFALDQLGRTGEARAAYARAATMCRELRRQVQAANTLLRLADTCRRLGDDHEAAAATAEADEILRLSGRQILEP